MYSFPLAVEEIQSNILDLFIGKRKNICLGAFENIKKYFFFLVIPVLLEGHASVKLPCMLQ